MRKPLLATALAGCLLLLAAAFIFHRMGQRFHATTEGLRQSEERHADASRKLRALERSAHELAARLAIAEEENRTLRAALNPHAKTHPASSFVPPPRIGHATVDARYEHARALAKSGNHAEALAEFLWCYDEGMPRVAGFGGVRDSYLLGEIARLGEKYPAALDALRGRRDQALDAIIADPDDRGAFSDFSSLNHALKEDHQNLTLFEKLPAGDERRGMLGLSVYEMLTTARRYDEALEAHSFRSMTDLFDALTEERDIPGMSEEKIAQIRKHNRTSSIKTAAGNLEVLLGAGKLEQAQSFAARVLAYDDTPDTRQLLRDAAAKAGRPDFPIP